MDIDDFDPLCTHPLTLSTAVQPTGVPTAGSTRLFTGVLPSAGASMLSNGVPSLQSHELVHASISPTNKLSDFIMACIRL